MSDWPFFDYHFYNAFCEGSNSVRLSDLVMISEEHWENYKMLFLKGFGQSEFVS